ncbi:hypothetical protein TRSC58_02271 [Trypanosoma rangeli SC58]|uniref:Fe2OG dioxygenase domain-containing protein n=1 Tax=Trypanosoma rangeli SC58 TaxID=429131 RepID=A0A061J7B4_TRYRA|nr:hypothetical protein TRSC58_02271 [Trypanosoma rangeli SC58]
MDFARRILLHASMPEVARREFLDDIEQRSVFRIWRYSPGTGCRPHYDPGLCTALLQSSAPGLEVNLQRELPSRPGRHGDYRYDEPELEDLIDALPGWQAPTPPATGDDTLLLRSNMAGVLSNSALPPVLHRVRSDWAQRGEKVRYSLVVEMRPSHPRRWYNLHKQLKAGAEMRVENKK